MSELQTVSGSESQSIELSDAELQSIQGGLTVYLGLIVLEGVVKTVASAAVALKAAVL